MFNPVYYLSLQVVKREPANTMTTVQLFAITVETVWIVWNVNEDPQSVLHPPVLLIGTVERTRFL